MKKCLILLTFLNICSCKKFSRDPEYRDFIFSVKVENKGSKVVTLEIGAEGGNFNKCEKYEDEKDFLVPAGTRDTFSMVLRCLDPPANRYAHFSIQKTLSDKANAMKVAYAEFKDLKEALTPGLDVAWLMNLAVTKGKTSAAPWIPYGGVIESSDLPASLARPDIDGMQQSPVRILSRKVAIFVDVPDFKTSVDIGLPSQLFPKETDTSIDGFVYTPAIIGPLPAVDGTFDPKPLHELVCDSDQCTLSVVTNPPGQ